MQIRKGKVDKGVIRIEGENLPDGTTVTVLAHEADETFELDASQEQMLLEAIAEADRGEVVCETELLERIVPHDFTLTDPHRK